MRQLISVGGSEGNTSCVRAGLIPSPCIWFCLLAHRGPFKPTISYNLLLPILKWYPESESYDSTSSLLGAKSMKRKHWSSSLPGVNLLSLCIFFKAAGHTYVPAELLSWQFPFHHLPPQCGHCMDVQTGSPCWDALLWRQQQEGEYGAPIIPSTFPSCRTPQRHHPVLKGGPNFLKDWCDKGL